MLVPNSQDDIRFEFLANSKVGFKISGGADSAIVAYMLARYKMDHDPSIRLVPITFISEAKPYQQMYADQVLAKIQELTGVEWYDRIVERVRSTEPEYGQDQQAGTDRARDEGRILYQVAGITRNPPKEVYDTWLPETGPTDERDDIGVKKDQWKNRLNMIPLININKQGVRELYDYFGVLDDIFPLTRSCEETREDMDFSTHCETCWFCREREWGFGRFV